jgi:hypothetical protein
MPEYSALAQDHNEYDNLQVKSDISKHIASWNDCPSPEECCIGVLEKGSIYSTNPCEP